MLQHSQAVLCNGLNWLRFNFWNYRLPNASGSVCEEVLFIYLFVCLFIYGIFEESAIRLD